MSVGDINVRSDLQYERYRIARPRPLWDLIRRTPGLGDPTEFGPAVPNVAGPEQTMVDEVELNQTPNLAEPPPVATFAVPDARGIVNTSPNRQSLLAAADGEGLVDAASVGLVNPDQSIFYSAALANDPDTFATVYDADADLLLTDTNRTRARRWGALRENTGYTERAGETPLSFDPTDQRLDVFPGTGDDEATVSVQRTRDDSTVGATVTATAYGNPITYTPDDRPVQALDGNPLTAWRVGAIDEVVGEKLFIDLDHPVTTSSVNLLQPINLERSRWITKARLTFDDGDSMVVDLDESSRDESGAGQTVEIGERTFSKLTIEVLEANIMGRIEFNGLSGVGFAEVRIPGVGVEDVIRPPVDLLDRAGPSSIGHRLTLLFTRLRSNQAEPVRTDEENAIRRAVDLPTARSFLYGGQARLAAGTPDWAVDAIVGMPDASQGGVTATSDVRLPGSLTQRASAAIDGDATTAWTSIYQNQIGHFLEYEVPEPITFDHLDLDIVADGRHSVPTQIGIDADGQRVGTIDIPPIADLPLVDGRNQENATVPVRIDLPAPVTGSTLRFTIEGVRELSTRDWYSNHMTTAPVSIAELGIDGLHADAPPATFDSGCIDTLLSVDGNPLSIRVHGATEDALARQALTAEACGPDADGVELDAGEHIFRTTAGTVTGIDLDRLVFASERGGDPLPLDQLPSQVPAGPTVTVDAQLAVESRGTVAGTEQPYWLVMGQSLSKGWNAQVGGVDLGAPTLIDGYANGWYVDPAVVGTGDLAFTITWKPQQAVWVAIGISAASMVICLGLMLFGGRRPRRARAIAADPLRPVEPAIVRPWPLRPPSNASLDPASRPSMLLAVIVAVVFAVAAAANITNQRAYPLLGVAIGAALFVALRDGRWRSWLGLAAAGAYALTAAFVVVQQLRHQFWGDFTWPAHFERVHILALAAIFLLLAEGVTDLVRGAVRSAQTHPEREAPAPADP
jgi:arabinofuranan 3-O-arabinosyltransferase